MDIKQMGNPWAELMATLAPLGDTVADRALHFDDPQSRHETFRNLAIGLAQGIFEHLHNDVGHPEFVPHLNNVFNLAATVPDYMYQTALVNGAGTYRVSGFRGTSRFVDIDVFGGHHATGGVAHSVANVTLDDLELDDKGYFSMILSAERPPGYEGDWLKLGETASMLLVRHAACDWRNEIDARLAIERLDTPAQRPRMQPGEIAVRLSNLASWTERVVLKWLDHVDNRRRQGIVNRLERLSYAAGAAGQTMFDGLFTIAPDEALIVESDLPKSSRYWSVLLTDDQLMTIDWVNRQSSLNDLQAMVDADGRLRVVVCARDPGIPNWLDTAGYANGTIQLRWNQPSDSPEPTTKLVPWTQIKDYLHADTPLVSPQQRDASLRKRREGAQLRRKW